MNAVYVWNVLSLLVYVLVIHVVVKTGLTLRNAILAKPLRIPVAAFLAALLCQAVSFLVLQWDWIASDHNAAVGDLPSLGWLLFDYFNGIAMLAFAIGLKTYLSWKVPGADDCGKRYYRRRMQDQP